MSDTDEVRKQSPITTRPDGELGPAGVMFLALAATVALGVIGYQINEASERAAWSDADRIAEQEMGLFVDLTETRSSGSTVSRVVQGSENDALFDLFSDGPIPSRIETTVPVASEDESEALALEVAQLASTRGYELTSQYDSAAETQRELDEWKALVERDCEGIADGNCTVETPSKSLRKSEYRVQSVVDGAHVSMRISVGADSDSVQLSMTVRP